MPAPRAVLADITDRGIDPKLAHRHTKADGRIPAPAAPVAEEPLKLALKKLPEAPKAEVKVAEEPKVEEPKKVEAPVVEVKPEAPAKPAKKEKAPKVVPTPEPVPAAETDDAKKA